MKTRIVSGNFAADIEGDLDLQKQVNVGSDEKPENRSVEDIVTEAGLTYIVQRDGLSSVYKSLLKKGEKRNALDFADETAKQFESALEKALAPYGDFSVAVAQHVPSEGGASPMVRATAFVESLLDGGDKEVQLRATLGVLGLADAADADKTALIDFAHSKGLGIQPPTRPGTKKAVATA